MGKHIINPPTMATPPGYSYAVKKSGTRVFIAGQVSIDAQGRIVGEGDSRGAGGANVSEPADGRGGVRRYVPAVTVDLCNQMRLSTTVPHLIVVALAPLTCETPLEDKRSNDDEQYLVET